MSNQAGRSGKVTLMSPFVSLIIKQLPKLIPVVESLVHKTPPAAEQRDERLHVIEQSLYQLMDRSQRLEARLRRMTLLAVFSAVVALIAVIAAFVR